MNSFLTHGDQDIYNSPFLIRVRIPMILGIYGSNGSGREVMEIARIQNVWDEIVFIDDFNESDSPVRKISFEHFRETYPADSAMVVISLGETKDREMLRKRVTDAGYRLGAVRHPSAYISPDAKIGDGFIARANVVVSCGADIGENVQLFEGSTIGHDTVIGIDSIISAKVSIGGNCDIGSGVYIGMSAAVKEKTRIGNHSTIGMSTAVFKDVDENLIVLGNPGRPMKTNTESRVFN